MERLTVSIVGGSGYAGGELLRLLLQHPHCTVREVSSQSQAGKPVTVVHPNVRGRTELTFVRAEQLQSVDLLFLAMPHGSAAQQIEQYAGRAARLIDLSADFRLRDPAVYAEWYGKPHPCPEWLPRFVYGLPETQRAKLDTARWVSGVGCNATAVNLALLPLVRSGLVENAICDLKVGSSEGGNEPSLATHHPERSGSFRSFAPVGHRHQAEIIQELGTFPLHLTATAVEMVRGILCTAHVFLKERLSERDIWKLYRQAYADEPFVRIVNERQGLYRLPEPKLLAGTNFCDVGFKVDERSGRVVVLSALDNLMKGAAGTAVQCLNRMCAWPETTALDFPGLHPI